MTPEHDALLCRQFPAMFAQRNDPTSPLWWGFECGDGWFQLILDLCQALQATTDAGAPQVIAAQVKEKFGSLRFYTESRTTDEQDSLIRLAERRAEETCEVCGSLGQPSNGTLGGVRCGAHVMAAPSG